MSQDRRSAAIRETHPSHSQRNGPQRNCLVMPATTSLALLGSLLLCTPSLHAFRVYDVTAAGYGVARWDAELHLVEGEERSLDGGLRYSIEGQSYEVFRDKFQWDGTPPTVAEFQTAVEQAFAAWEVVDPATGLGTDVRFVPDLDTPPFLHPEPSDLSGYFRLNPGSEIDIFASKLSYQGGQADSFGDPNATTVTLTSGVTNYNAAVFSGADIRMSTKEPWTLDFFQQILSHEIGHAIGLGDADAYHDLEQTANSRFYDDNYDGSRQSTAIATLTNSFADVIVPLDPDNSPGLMLYDICTPTDPEDLYSCYGNPGIDTKGVNIFMESSTGGTRPPTPQNDDLAGRQFLYPFVRISGDFNADSRRGAEDIDLLSQEIATEEPRLWFDLNGDDAVTREDRDVWVHDLQSTYFGDANLDGEFNTDDLSDVLAALTYESDVDAGWAGGDFDGNRRFDTDDLIKALADGGYEQGPRTAVSAVPEPTSCVTVTALLVLTISYRRRSEGFE